MNNASDDVSEVDAYTVEEFCRRHRISVQLFYKYPDLMPDSFQIGTSRRISREAAARWRKEREIATATAEAAGSPHSAAPAEGDDTAGETE